MDHSAFIPANVPPFLSPIRSGDFKWESSRGMVHSSLPLFSRQGSGPLIKREDQRDPKPEKLIPVSRSGDKKDRAAILDPRTGGGIARN